MRIIFDNRKAYFNFEILDKLESGIKLYGWEVKALKNGMFSMGSSYIKNVNNELFLMNTNVSSKISTFKIPLEEESRMRKLLVNKREIINLTLKSKAKGLTLIPLDMYINDVGKIKLTIALVKGKKKIDKKETIKKRDLDRSIEYDRKRYNI